MRLLWLDHNRPSPALYNLFIGVTVVIQVSSLIMTTSPEKVEMLVRGFVVWCLLLVMAVANGALREAILIPRVGQQVGHIVSTISLSIGILIATYISVPWIRPSTPREALAVGAAWLVLTLTFEFGFGRYRGKTWSELLVDYNLFQGRIWILVLLVTLAAPLLAARMRGLFADQLISQ